MYFSYHVQPIQSVSKDLFQWNVEVDFVGKLAYLYIGIRYLLMLVINFKSN